ncbi:hypothetical protein [Actinomadura sp. HBU206391]|uniref:hypothetical protein n=1 Tax=Actinomadura sp. HBU206391 TaxID=2731692 RepID=UPI0016506C87|nr:hypothetical protein [Actinomadura sp. HBU206391]MBC6458888.1 hypothetical protein [Actinomadura sp. HBU206391]
MSAASVTPAELVEFAQRELAFLAQGGMDGLDERGTQTVLAYVRPEITLELELDWREETAFMLVCRTVGGRPPPGYYRHDGRLMRMHLAEALTGVTSRTGARPSGCAGSPARPATAR